MVKHSLALKKTKGKWKQHNVANDIFTVKSKAQKTMDNFLLKKPNEETNYRLNKRKLIVEEFWEKMDPQKHHFHNS